MNGTNNFSKLWIYPVVIILNTSIPSSNFIPFRCNWVKIKIPIIPRHVEIFMLHIFYALNAITTGGKMAFSWCLLLFVSIS